MGELSVRSLRPHFRLIAIFSFLLFRNLLLPSRSPAKLSLRETIFNLLERVALNVSSRDSLNGDLAQPLLNVAAIIGLYVARVYLRMGGVLITRANSCSTFIRASGGGSKIPKSKF